MGRLFNYTIFPLLLPGICLWLLVARLLSFVAPLLVFPVIMFNRRLVSV